MTVYPGTMMSSIDETVPIDAAKAPLVTAGRSGVARAATVLQAGGLVAFPTETVYGLGADATNDRAVAAIFAAKERPRFNPLIIHIANFEMARRLARFDERAVDVASRFWPGALTLVLPRRPDSGVSRLASAGLDTIALRMPAHPMAQELLAKAGLPIAAPSANRSGTISPTSPKHVLASLGDRIALILAAGRCAVGVESTILDLTGSEPRELRSGGVPREALAEVLGPIAVDEADDGNRPQSPGRLARHYAPGVPVRLAVREVGADEALLTFGPDLRKGPLVRNLSEGGDLTEAAANLFAMLHDLDRPDIKGIAVAPIPETGLGAAINDRLRRAAAKADA